MRKTMTACNIFFPPTSFHLILTPTAQQHLSKLVPKRLLAHFKKKKSRKNTNSTAQQKEHTLPVSEKCQECHLALFFIDLKAGEKQSLS